MDYNLFSIPLPILFHVSQCIASRSVSGQRSTVFSTANGITITHACTVLTKQRLTSELDFSLNRNKVLEPVLVVHCIVWCLASSTYCIQKKKRVNGHEARRLSSLHCVEVNFYQEKGEALNIGQFMSRRTVGLRSVHAWNTFHSPSGTLALVSLSNVVTFECFLRI